MNLHLVSEEFSPPLHQPGAAYAELPTTIVVVSEKMIVSDLTEDPDDVQDTWNMREYWQEDAEDSSEAESFEGENFFAVDREEEEEEATDLQYQKMLRMLEEESFFFKRGASNAIVGSSYRDTPPLLQLRTGSTEELHYSCLREELVEELL